MLRRPPPLLGRDAAHLEAELDILLHRLPRKQCVFLEDHAAAYIDAPDRRVVEQDTAAGRFLEAGNQAEQRRLTAARAADDAQDLAGENVERQAAEGMDYLVAALVLHADIFDADDRGNGSHDNPGRRRWPRSRE